MNGLIYLLDQAGVALQQANAEIERLNVENTQLREALAEQPAQDA